MSFEFQIPPIQPPREQIHPRILCVELNDDDDDDDGDECNDDDDDDNCSPKLVESESGVRKLALARIAAFTRNHQAACTGPDSRTYLRQTRP